MLEKKSIVSVKCSDIMSDQNVKLAGHIQNLVGQCHSHVYIPVFTVYYSRTLDHEISTVLHGVIT